MNWRTCLSIATLAAILGMMSACKVETTRVRQEAPPPERDVEPYVEPEPPARESRTDVRVAPDLPRWD